jgi:superfamily II DNA or RNA helicase
MLHIIVSPYKRLYLNEGTPDSLVNQKPNTGAVGSVDVLQLKEAFSRGSGHGLLCLDLAHATILENNGFAYWQNFVRLYLSFVSHIPDLDNSDISTLPLKVPLPEDDRDTLLLSIPLMKGAEYIDHECLLSLWEELGTALHTEILEYGKGITAFFTNRHSSWNLLGRVCFHLAENKNSPDTPFAFLATYTHRISTEGTSKHLPLNAALKEYAAAKQKDMLIKLLEPIAKASEESSFLKGCVDSGDIYHPLAWTASQTYTFLKDIPLFEQAGIAVKVPNWWKQKQPNSPTLKIKIGEDAPSGVGFGALVDFNMEIALGDDPLNETDIQELLLRSENLVFFKGQWVEIDKEKLHDLLGKWKSLSKEMKNGGVTFAEGMRWLSGMGGGGSAIDGSEVASTARVISGAWLTEALEKMHHPDAHEPIEHILGDTLKATLRPYQRQGVSWLNMLNQLNLGAILADDMGLGKTIQVITLLLLKKHQDRLNAPSLLIVPASLIGNWKNEISRFAPSLTVRIAHPSADGTGEPKDYHFDILITTYGSTHRLPWLTSQTWDMIILDEAQAIKNPSAKQTTAVKSLQSLHRLALTGTPVENRLSDLWSLFDFISPGLLGNAKAFTDFMKPKKEEASTTPYAALRKLVSPYILRRLKTDKAILSDLPDKTEIKAYCELSKAQVALYQQAVDSLTKEIYQNTEGQIKRQGIIFSYLMRFKQICNHPSQMVKDGKFALNDSGKFLRLREICETISEKQEKLLVFTQFQEMAQPLNNFLKGIFGKEGLVLHGGTKISKRAEMVDSFQRPEGPPYFILSLKAGGTGLNLTAASHVIHFDRWWNPAVENQATDRAFRIGQKRNVLVHKFICKGTLEEKIDEMIESKKNISDEILGNGNDNLLLTTLSNEALLQIISLDIHAASAEAA